MSNISLKKFMNKKILAINVTFIIFTFLTFFSSFTHANDGFKLWIQDFKKVALFYDISSSTFDAAFETVHTIDPEVLRRAAYQPEFIDSPWNYFDNRIDDSAILEGRKHSKKWEQWLDKIENRFGVNRHVLLAIWSIESSYGKALENGSAMYDAIRSLATLAYADKKREKYARSQLIAAMQILQSGEIHRSQLTGSWAGALGHTQFIPSSYLAYAVDMDGDGRRNIWTSIPDALATAANLLRMNGWRSDLSWGLEVKLPHGKQFSENSLSFKQWAELGVQSANGQPFPAPSEQATLKLLDGQDGPAFLVTKNFFVLKRYNNADRYALAVSLLSDRIAGRPGLVNDWNRPFKSITFQERMELQSLLAALGDYEGEIDGKIGTGSKQAIKAFQTRHGLQVNGYPSHEILLLLRKEKSNAR
ncbi:lytic murein transglycosylase [Bartonella ancashensis]